MTETTVKVRVREIMRKLGVSNRTQVATDTAVLLSCLADKLRPYLVTLVAQGEALAAARPPRL
jgi:predicted DNA-binding transcriptional regulator